jgi:NAD(P)H dehydrogenase (quinone)
MTEAWKEGVLTRILIVYHSENGTNQLMAEAVRDGAGSVEGCSADIVAIKGADFREGSFVNEESLTAGDEADAIVFGCPTYMGSMSAQMKSYLDASLSRWYARGWVDKVASAFSISSTPSGDKLSALTAIAYCAMQHGMIWVGVDQSPINADGLNRLGFYIGAGGQARYDTGETALQPGDAETGRDLGARVARITQTLVQGRGAD